ncbi:MAG: TetR/AcrR family transcriptional regulator [Phenylobacterium sp.]|uniref:TetR/AcrR family transcriptional regulator n=1 Tax=Phenylobacterium sp. TaxID=1871053 RepID=UPI001A479D3A|nr:TetR/AcrR family transcriptional regulator [Phenylobacterium sp.]MBL8773387.1 TetR/AcrR family transcriptional regulator [Phenylobacterium sp.]
MSPQPAVLTVRAQRTRDALIGAGRKLFAERPIDAVAIDDIVRAADVAKGSFYNHFADREALVKAVMTEIREQLEVAVGRVNAGVEDPARRIARALCVYQRYALDEPQRTRVLVRVSTGETNLSAPVNQGLADDLTAGLAAGRLAIATLESAMLFVMGASQAGLARTSREPSPALAVSLAQQLCALVLRGLGVPAGEAEAIAAQAADEIVRGGAAAGG